MHVGRCGDRKGAIVCTEDFAVMKDEDGVLMKRSAVRGRSLDLRRARRVDWLLDDTSVSDMHWVR